MTHVPERRSLKGSSLGLQGGRKEISAALAAELPIQVHVLASVPAFQMQQVPGSGMKPHDEGVAAGRDEGREVNYWLFPQT